MNVFDKMVLLHFQNKIQLHRETVDEIASQNQRKNLQSPSKNKLSYLGG